MNNRFTAKVAKSAKGSRASRPTLQRILGVLRALGGSNSPASTNVFGPALGLLLLGCVCRQAAQPFGFSHHSLPARSVTPVGRLYFLTKGRRS